MILKLASGYFSFLHATSILDTITQKADDSAKDLTQKLQMLLPNFEGITGMGSTALNMMKELLSLAGRKEFRVVLVGCQPEVEDALVTFLESTNVEQLIGGALMGKRGEAKGVGTTTKLAKRAEELATSREDNKFILVGDQDDENRFIPTNILALEFAECYTIATGDGSQRKRSASESDHTVRLSAYGESLKNPTLQAAKDE